MTSARAAAAYPAARPMPRAAAARYGLAVLRAAGSLPCTLVAVALATPVVREDPDDRGEGGPHDFTLSVAP